MSGLKLGSNYDGYTSLNNYGIKMPSTDFLSDSSYGLTSQGPSLGGYATPSILADYAPMPETNLFSSMGQSIQQSLQKSGLIGHIDPVTKQKVDGWGSLALGTVSGLGSAFMGMKQYGLMKDQFKFQKDSFNKNFAAQRGLINSELEDRQRQRVRENPNQAVPVADYMAKYGVKA